jgi:hypothetical protein
MPRKPWKVKRTMPQLSPVAVAYLSDDDGAAAALSGPETWVLACYRGGMGGFDSDSHPRELWEQYGADFLREFIKAHPCQRPLPWWQWDAPRWTRTFSAWFDGTLPEPRQRLGGVGAPDFEVLAMVPRIEYGLPVGWVSPFDVAYYNGRLPVTRDAWPPRSRQPREGDFAGVAIDPADPPTFESEAAYLQRHGCLTPAETQWLAAHPEALAPEVIEPDATERSGDYVPSLAKSERAAPCR